MDSEQEQPISQQRASTPGATLAAAREAMGLSVEQVADQLKLAPRQVQAIEQDDFDALPNRAVTRGFIRAYAKAMRLDPAPLVAMVEVEAAEGHATATVRPTRVQASFQESRFPSLNERNSGKPLGAIVAGVAVLALVGFGVAWQMGVLAPLTLATRGGVDAPAAVPEPAASMVIAQPGAQPAEAPLQTQSVPLISIPPQPGSSNAPATVAGAGVPGAAAGGAVPPAAMPGATANVPAAPANVPAAAPGLLPAKPAAPGAVPTPPAAAPSAAAPAAAPLNAAVTAPATAPVAGQGPAVGAAGGKLVLTVKQDSWIEIRRPGQAALVARLVKAGSTETFNVREKDLLIVGKPSGVSANLAGAQLELPPVPGGTISRTPIK